MSEKAEEGDHHIKPPTLDQAMVISVSMVQGLIETFIDPEDSDEEKATKAYICLAIFLHQLCVPAKRKDKMIALLKIIIKAIEEEK